MNQTRSSSTFFLTFFKIAFFIIAQNLITYSVNVADNVMLGSYSQTALSGAAAVNQLQFLLQQVMIGLGEGLVTLSSRYWGNKDVKPIYGFFRIALSIGLSVGLVLTALTSLFPGKILYIFTPDQAIITAGSEYLNIMRFTYLPFIITSILLSALRSFEKVKIGFATSCISLVANICINYILIFGHFGAPKLGIVGAAIGTLTARLLELVIIVLYVRVIQPGLLKPSLDGFRGKALKTYVKTSFPVVLTQTIFGLSISLQTVILGRLSSDAIAANSAATTIFQYLKLIAVGCASATVVVIGKTIGSGKTTELKKQKNQLQFVYLVVGLLICLLLNLVKHPLIGLYALTPEARTLAIQIITVLSVVAIGMSYQMPVSAGIIRGCGDTKFTLKLDLICIWLIMYPVSLLAAFVWKLPAIVVIALLNSDQIYKCIPAFIKVNLFFRISHFETSSPR
ncbi:MAG: MATE family efflux transporter [Lachnospiraceae bacterium]